jgi:hypothetical protein
MTRKAVMAARSAAADCSCFLVPGRSKPQQPSPAHQRHTTTLGRRSPTRPQNSNRRRHRHHGQLRRRPDKGLRLTATLRPRPNSRRADNLNHYTADCETTAAPSTQARQNNTGSANRDETPLPSQTVAFQQQRRSLMSLAPPTTAFSRCGVKTRVAGHRQAQTGGTAHRRHVSGTNATAQQPGGWAGRHVTENRNGRPVCCSDLFGGYCVTPAAISL